MTADYTITIEEVCLRFATRCIVELPMLSILSFEEKIGDRLQIPTWVPDLTKISSSDTLIVGISRDTNTAQLLF